MSVLYDSEILASAPFEFIVGPEKKSFSIYSKLVSHFSEPLDRKINGPWKESADQCTTIEDVDEATFLRFMQFLYTENYAVPEPIIEPHMSSDGDGGLDVRLKNGEEFAPTPPPPPPPPPPEDWAEVPAEEVLEEAPPAEGLPEELPIVEPFDDDWDFWGAGRKKKATRKSGKSNRPSSPSGKERLRLIFQSSGYMLPPATPTSNQMSTHARPNENVHERYAEIFLCHAKLYTFADRYQIDRLKRLCLRQLHITLLNFSLYRDRVEDILHLIRFSYSNENTADKNSDSIDGLRELVVRYAACIGQELWAHEEFKELLVDENQFARDIFGKVIKVIDKKDKQ